MRFSRPLCSVAAAFLLGALGAPGRAAEPAKRPFAHTDFESFRAITGQTLSRDGRYLGYAYLPLEGDGDLIVREIATGREVRVPAGALPAVPVTGSDADPERPPPRRSVNVVFTSDSRFAVANTFPERAATLAASAQSTPITLSVDLTDAPRKILHATETIPVQPGPLTLVYPEWIPGEHGPTGPIAHRLLSWPMMRSSEKPAIFFHRARAWSSVLYTVTSSRSLGRPITLETNSQAKVMASSLK